MYFKPPVTTHRLNPAPECNPGAFYQMTHPVLKSPFSKPALSLVAGLMLFAGLLPTAVNAQSQSPAVSLAARPSASPSEQAFEAHASQVLGQLGLALNFTAISMVEMVGAEMLLPLSICPQTMQFYNLASTQLQESINRIESEIAKMPAPAPDPVQGPTGASLAELQQELKQFRLKLREQAAMIRARAVQRLGSSLPKACEKATEDSAADAAFLLQHKDTVLAYMQNTDWANPPQDKDLPAVLQGGDKSPFALAFERYRKAYSKTLGL